MAILAKLQDGTQVEVVNVFQGTGGKRVLVKACQGEPFMNYGFGGGWYPTSWATVSQGQLKNVRGTNGSGGAK